jgi:predicted nucleic acid-binding protein
MTDLGFVDTNLFVYSKDLSEPAKAERANEWLRALWLSGEGRTSVQALNECYSVFVGKLSPGISRAEARTTLLSYVAWSPQALTIALAERAWALQDRFSLSWWDALIVAAAQVQGCAFLLTEDLQAGQRFDNLLVVNPFLTAPAEVLRR